MTEQSFIPSANNGNIDSLVSVIENHSDDSVRLDALHELKKLNLSQNQSQIAVLLESLVVSDENIQIRARALEIIVNKFLNLMFKISKWIIESEKNVY